MSADGFKRVSVPFDHIVTVEGIAHSIIVLREPDMEAVEAVEELGIFERGPLLKPDGSVQKDEKGEEIYPPLKVKEIRKLIAILGNIPEAVVLKMHPRDFNRAARHIGPLLESYSRGAEEDKGETEKTPGAP